jgi:hypothetical protein
MENPANRAKGTDGVAKNFEKIFSENIISKSL